MDQKYSCPVCRQNQTKFEIIYKLIQEIHKDPDTGKVIYVSDILDTPLRNRHSELEIRCTKCGYVAREWLFIQTAKREEQAIWTKPYRK